MAITDNVIDGKDILFWVKRDTDTDYLLVACLQSNDFNGTTATTDSSSKCGDTSTPGQKSSSVSISGWMVFGTNTFDLEGALETPIPVMSGPELYELWASGNYFDWFLGKAKDLENADDFSLEGRGYLSSFDWTNPNGDKSQFSGTVTNSENPSAIFAPSSE